MSTRRVVVRVPATSGNLGAGFDCLGMALDLWAQVTLTAGDAQPPSRPIEGLITEAGHAYYRSTGKRAPAGLSATWEGPVPVARGLGASAAARVGGLLAAAALAGDGPPDRELLLVLAADLEGHADNAAPALFGGVQVVVREPDGVAHTGVRLPEGVKAVLLVPDLEMPTYESRRLLPKELSRQDAVYNIGRAALLVAALAGGRFDLLDVATRDRLHQPARARLFPAMDDVFKAAKDAGALCAWLSGGGSTIAALALADEERIARAMLEAAAARGYSGNTVITAPTEQGASVADVD